MTVDTWCPMILNGIEAVFSPGVAEYAKFEEYFANLGVPNYLADFSVDAPPISHPNFHFIKKYLGRRNSSIYITLPMWMHSVGETGNNALLQMDIEAAEWMVLPHLTRKQFRRFRIIVIEFHDLPDVLFKRRSFKIAARMFRRILTDFEVVHIHQNNCCGQEWHEGIALPRLAEFTFLRKDRIDYVRGFASLPNSLDRPNAEGIPELPIPAIWNGEL